MRRALRRLRHWLIRCYVVEIPVSIKVTVR